MVSHLNGEVLVQIGEIVEEVDCERIAY